ncbi:MAG: protein-export chaperone SecB [Firmicutes bacterium]|nr:protein-export chaperone SecB [Bacillota bacterium]
MLKLNLTKMYFESYNFKRDSEHAKVGASLKIKNDISPKFNNDNQIQVKMTLEIQDEPNTFSLNVSMVGVFDIEFSGALNEDLKTAIQNNILTIMYPHLRSQVSLLTTMPDFTPIMLPLLNLNNSAMSGELK